MSNASIGYPPGPAASESRKLLLSFRRDTLRFWCDLHDTYGDFVQFTLGGSHMYSLRDPQLIREVLVDKNAIMRRTDYTWDTLGRFLGEGLAVSHGEVHRRRRSIIQPLFTPAWIDGYTNEIWECTQELMASWQHNDIRNISDDMHHLTLNIIYRTIFGTETGELEGQIKNAVAVIQAASAQRMQTGTIQTDESVLQQTLQTLNDAIDDLVSRSQEKGRKTLLSLLAESTADSSSTLTATEIREEVLTFFMAGQETSANALAWAWHLLGSHPTVQTKLQNEIRDVVQEQPLAPERFAQMPYLESVLKETLRIFPPAWIIGRCALEPVEIGGYTIEPNEPINICIYALHRNTKVFPDPEAFIPERFVTEPPRYSYLPFGAGAHICIGQPLAMLEMGIALISMLQAWDIRPVAGTLVTPEAMMTLRPAPNVLAEVVRR
ncbi:MAG: cytochrome P450 [Anaerolineae bacterium]|nr:cytochrome P450 [Anaerolineae bacterium]